MAQLVARLTGGQEAACSSHVTPTRLSLDAIRVQTLSFCLKHSARAEKIFLYSP